MRSFISKKSGIYCIIIFHIFSFLMLQCLRKSIVIQIIIYSHSVLYYVRSIQFFLFSDLILSLLRYKDVCEHVVKLNNDLIMGHLNNTERLSSVQCKRRSGCLCARAYLRRQWLSPSNTPPQYLALPEWGSNYDRCANQQGLA